MQQDFIINRQSSIVNLQSFFICPPPLYICREPPTNQLLFMQNKPNFRRSQMNLKFCKQMDYEYKSDWTIGQNKPNSNPIKPNFKRDNGFSPQGVPGTAYYTRDCHVTEFTLSAAEGGLAMTFFGSFPASGCQPEKNVGTMNLLVIKSYKFYLNCLLLLSNY